MVEDIVASRWKHQALVRFFELWGPANRDRFVRALAGTQAAWIVLGDDRLPEYAAGGGEGRRRRMDARLSHLGLPVRRALARSRAPGGAGARVGPEERVYYGRVTR